MLQRMGATNGALWGAAITGIAGSRLQGLRVSARRRLGACRGVQRWVSRSAAMTWAVTAWEQQVKPRVLEVALTAAENKKSSGRSTLGR